MRTTETDETNTQSSASPWSPLRIVIFRYLWLATLVSNIGTWMHEIGAGWLMTDLAHSPVMVALVQTAVTLPSFLLALPAGALSDILDRRHYLLAVNVWMMCIAALLSILTITGNINEWSLLGLTFGLGIGMAMMIPAWQAIIPEVVPKHELQQAIGLNTMGMNTSRAIGPALAGMIVAVAGSGAVFLLNAFSFLFIILVLWRWRREPYAGNLPAERFASALKIGIRFVRNAPALYTALFRGTSFFLFASALWALLPLIAKVLLQGGPQTFGVLLTTIGIGAVGGALVLPKLRLRFGNDKLIFGGSLLYATALLTTASNYNLFMTLIAMACSGMAWITVMTATQVACQMALPNWVRSRGMSVFFMTMMGSLAGGSYLWGNVAKHTDIPTALLIASLLTIVAAVIARRWSVEGIDQIDHTPSRHWHLPESLAKVHHERSPVMVLIHYQVEEGNEREFLDIMNQLGRIRRRDGAYAWDVLEDAAKAGQYIEYYLVESWLEHLRQHERISNTDRRIQDRIRKLLVKDTTPRVTHYVGPGRD